MSNLVVLDFDDTIFPSSFVKSVIDQNGDPEVDFEWFKGLFSDGYDRLLSVKLRKLMNKSGTTTLLVSSAKFEWGMSALENFLPATMQLLCDPARVPNVHFDVKDKVSKVNELVGPADHIHNIISCGDKASDEDISSHVLEGHDIPSFFVKMNFRGIPEGEKWNRKHIADCVTHAVRGCGEMFRAVDMLIGSESN